MMAYKISLSPEDRDTNTYHPAALYDGRPANEHEQMVRLADMLQVELERCGFQVANMQYGNMKDRVADANKWGADLYIALHTNAYNTKVQGTRVHCYPSDKSRRIAQLIQDRIAPLSPGTVGEGVKETTRLYELRATTMTAVLPEYEFHDNLESAQWIIDNLQTIAVETAKAVCEFFNVPYVEEQSDKYIYRVQLGAFCNYEYATAFLADVQKTYPEAFIKKEAM